MDKLFWSWVRISVLFIHIVKGMSFIFVCCFPQKWKWFRKIINVMYFDLHCIWLISAFFLFCRDADLEELIDFQITTLKKKILCHLVNEYKTDFLKNVLIDNLHTLFKSSLPLTISTKMKRVICYCNV